MSYIGNQPTTTAFLTDTFSANGSGTVFTLSAAPANTNSIIVAVSGVLQDPSTYSVSGTSLTFSAAPPAGTGNISVRFLGIPASGVTTTAYRTVTEFTATAGQTTFTPSSYTVGYINVYRNGALLGTADYTATNGTTVVLANPASLSDLVVVESFYVSSVLNAIPAVSGAVNSAYLSSNLSLVTPSVTTTLGVGGATPSTSGAGITFPATASASSDANTLDDYEEGTWTPTLTYTGGNGNLSYAINDGTYIKIGKMVMFTCHLQFGETTASGYIDTINGLPFTSTARAGGGFNIDNMTGLTGGAQWQMLSSATTMIPVVSGTGTAGTISSTNTGAATNVIVLSGVYRA
jgi:hypothetical protein